MITKEMFGACIDAIQQQEEYDRKCTDAFQIILNEDRVTIGYDNGILTRQLIKLLVACMNDKGDWIEYFIYDLDYGKNYKEGCATHEDNAPIDLSTTDKLYDFLLNEINEKLALNYKFD